MKIEIDRVANQVMSDKEAQRVCIEIQRLQEIETQYEGVMDLLRRSRMEHGRCDSPNHSACTACTANEQLTDLVSKWKGRTVRLV